MRRECTEPVAWAVQRPDNEVTVIAFKRSDALECATASDRIVPLYRSPTLTDAEREAVHQAAIRFDGLCQMYAKDRAATLRGLLERLGGEK